MQGKRNGVCASYTEKQYEQIISSFILNMNKLFT